MVFKRCDLVSMCTTLLKRWAIADRQVLEGEVVELSWR